MPQFSDFEKQIISTIQYQENPGEKILGMLVKDVLFKSGQAAFTINGQVTYKDGTTSISSSLLAFANGGFGNHKVREIVVSFVSIMNYLVENRLIYIMQHDNMPRMALFYQDYDHMALSPKVVNSQERYGARINTIKEQFGNGDTIRFEETVEDGFSTSIGCIGITLNDGNILGPVGIDHKVKKELMRYLTCQVYPTLALSELVRNDFKNPEELASEKTIFLASQQVDKAQKTLIVAIVTLLFTIIPPLLTPMGFCKCILAFVLIILSFTMGFLIKNK